MSHKKRGTETKIDALTKVVEQGSKAEAIEALQQALREKSNFLVAKAAEFAGQKLFYDLIPDLTQAYERFLNSPLENDKTCAAKRAIVRGLYELDYDSAGFYRRGIGYVQLEPVWGGHVDTAVDLRCTCALGLAASNDPRAVLDIVGLLYDEESQARISAVKATESLHPFQAEIVLRGKTLQGDGEAEVIAQCFSSLMKVAPEESLGFVAGFLENGRESYVEGAALALGESRLDEALGMLIEATDNAMEGGSLFQSLCNAVALQRKEKAFDYLLGRLENGGESAACAAVTALAIYDFNSDLKEQVATRVQERNARRITECFREQWERQGA